MKILAVSDIESPRLYDYYRPGMLKKYDCIIACGDLRPEYLEFLVTMSGRPLFYVHGNHDEKYLREPEGCTCIDGRLIVYNGVRILGLGGSYRYRRGEYMYTEAQMKRRIFRLLPSLFVHKGFDILAAHAPARHLNDFDTLSHRGFDCFNKLIGKYRPALFIHGHIHRNYQPGIPQRSEFQGTTVINACEYAEAEI